MFCSSKSRSMATLLQQKNCMSSSLTNGAVSGSGSNATNNSPTDGTTATILSSHHDIVSAIPSTAEDIINSISTMPNAITTTTGGGSIFTAAADNVAAVSFINQSLTSHNNSQQQQNQNSSSDSFHNFNLMSNSSHFNHHQGNHHHIQPFATRYFSQFSNQSESDFLYNISSSESNHHNLSSSFDINNTSTNGTSISLSTATASAAITTPTTTQQHSAYSHHQQTSNTTANKNTPFNNQEPPISSSLSSSLVASQNLNAASSSIHQNEEEMQRQKHQQQIKTENLDQQQQSNQNTTDQQVIAAQQQADEEQEPEPEIDIVINNVVCSFSVRCHLNLREIALNGFNVEFRRENGMVTMKLRRPYTTASIWSSGRITCTGATSEEQAKIAARRYARCLQKLGFSVRFHNFRVVNVLGTCSMPWAIKIVNFSERYKKEASYEPELHPGVTYKLKYPKATLKIFSTGSITVTAGSVAHVQAAIEHIFPLVYEFRKKRTPEEIQLLRSKRPIIEESVINEEADDNIESFVHSPSAAKKRKRPPGCAENDADEDIMCVSDYEVDDQDDDAE